MSPGIVWCMVLVYCTGHRESVPTKWEDVVKEVEESRVSTNLKEDYLF